MSPRVSRLVPRSIAAQIVVLVVFAVLAFHLVSAALFALTHDRSGGPDAGPPVVVDRFAEFASLLDRLPAATRPALLEAIGAAYPNLGLTLLGPQQAAGLGAQAPHDQRIPGAEHVIFDHLRRSLDPGLTPFLPAGREGRAAMGDARTVAVRLHDGSVATANVLPIGPPPHEPGPMGMIMLTVSLVATMLTAFLWWAARGLVAPLSRFAGAARDFSVDRDPAPLPEDDGPEEVRAASRALNHMQARVRKMVDDRTRMLAAVSHDLRTPITRMRLRAEFMDPADMRAQMLRDLEQMDGMVHAALSYLREGQKGSAPALIDLASLLQMICNDFADLGADVTYEGPSRVPVRAHASELQRAVTNLVDNALKYGGGRATIGLRTPSDSEVVIDVIDAGSGIPADMKDAMLAPFARGDEARSHQEGKTGFGLGLSIVRAIAERHGGTLVLLDAEPSGLIARLRLPIRSDRPIPSVHAARP